MASSGTGSDTGTISDPGVSNQISFDELNDIRIKVVIDSTPANGTITIFSDGFSDTGVNATINFTNVTKYLFSDTSALSSGFNTEFEIDPSQQTAEPTEEAGDVIVLPSLLAGETGFVIAGTDSGETITFSDAADIAIIFGKGGGDTLKIDSLGDHLIIGGITSTDNIDDGSGGGTANDSIPDAGINVFDYSLLNGTDFSSTSANDGTLGVLALLGGFAGEAGGEGLVRENVTNSSDSRLLDLVWDVGSFIGSALKDAITMASGGFNTIDGNAGDDTFNLLGTAKFGTLIGGADNDTLNILQTNADFSGVTLSGVENVNLAAFSTVQTLTLDGSSSLGSATIASTDGDDIIQLAESVTSFDFSSVTLVNTVEIKTGTNGDTVVGTGSADKITGGTGADTITGGGGTDTIDLGNGETAGTDADIVAYTVASDGSATELIKNFIVANDKFQLDISRFSLSAGAGALGASNYVEDTQANISGNTGSILGSADITVITFTDTTTGSQAETALATAIGSNGATDMSTVFMVYNDGTDTFLAYDSNAATDSNGFTAMTIIDTDNAGASLDEATLSEANFTLVA